MYSIVRPARLLVKERKFAKKHNGHIIQPVRESFNDLQLGKKFSASNGVLCSYPTR